MALRRSSSIARSPIVAPSRSCRGSGCCPGPSWTTRARGVLSRWGGMLRGRRSSLLPRSVRGRCLTLPRRARRLGRVRRHRRLPERVRYVVESPQGGETRVPPGTFPWLAPPRRVAPRRSRGGSNRLCPRRLSRAVRRSRDGSDRLRPWGMRLALRRGRGGSYRLHPRGLRQAWVMVVPRRLSAARSSFCWLRWCRRSSRLRRPRRQGRPRSRCLPCPDLGWSPWGKVDREGWGRYS